MSFFSIGTHRALLVLGAALVCVGCDGDSDGNLSVSGPFAPNGGLSADQNAWRSWNLTSCEDVADKWTKNDNAAAAYYLHCKVWNTLPRVDQIATRIADLDDFLQTRRGLLLEWIKAGYGGATREQQARAALSILTGVAIEQDEVEFWSRWLWTRRYNEDGTQRLRFAELSDGEAHWLALNDLLSYLMKQSTFKNAHAEQLFQACSAERLERLVGSATDAALFLGDECVRWNFTGQLTLPAGRFTLGQTLVIDPPVENFAIRGQKSVGQCLGNDQQPRCDCDDDRPVSPCNPDAEPGQSGCAELFAADTFGVHDECVVKVESSRGLSIGAVVIDGNRQRRTAVLERQLPGNRSHRYNLCVNATGLTLQDSVIKEAVRGSGFTLTGAEHCIKRNQIVRNGWQAHQNWSDGLTGTPQNTTIRKNGFVDNTDVQLILGSCPGCRITENRFEHSGENMRGAWAELMFQAWPATITNDGTVTKEATTGDYREAVAWGNTIDCSNKRLCNFGILIGNESWAGIGNLAGGTATFGITAYNNTVKNAVMGITVDKATGPVYLYNNRVTQTGGWALYKVYRPNADETEPNYDQWLWNDAVTVSKESVQHVYGRGGSRKLDFHYTLRSYEMALAVMQGSLPQFSSTSTAKDNLPLPASTESNLGMIVPTTDEQRVHMLYLKFLGRTADSEGLAHWSARFASGEKPVELAIALMHSLEFTERHPWQTMNSDRFVALLYQLALHRTPDAAGFAFWTTALKTGAFDRLNVARWVINSKEFSCPFNLPETVTGHSCGDES